MTAARRGAGGAALASCRPASLACLLLLLAAAAAAATATTAAAASSGPFSRLGAEPLESNGVPRRLGAAPRRLPGAEDRAALAARRRANAAAFMREISRQQEERFASSRADATGQASVPGEEVFGDECDGRSCHTCVFVIGRLARGPDVMPSVVCREMLVRFPDSYPCCRALVDRLNTAGGSVRRLIYDGCYKPEMYAGAKEWVRPCPAPVICSRALTGRGTPYCEAPAVDNPFGGAAAGEGEGGAAAGSAGEGAGAAAGEGGAAAETAT